MTREQSTDPDPDPDPDPMGHISAPAQCTYNSAPYSIVEYRTRAVEEDDDDVGLGQK